MIVSNLHTIMIALAVIVGGIFSLTGFGRKATDEGESIIAYKEGRLRLNMGVAGTLVALAASLAFVPAGYTGVIYDVNDGVLSEPLSEGVHFVVPFKQHVTNVDTRVTVYTHDIEDKYILTLDTQEVRVPIAINYRVSNAPFVREFVRGDIATTIVEPALLRELRTIVGQYSLETVAENQNEINTLIEEGLTAHFEAHGLDVAYVSVLDVIPQRGIVAAIEGEKIEERNLITAEHRKNIATQDALALIESATGQAESIRLVAEARETEQDRLGLTPTEYVWFTRWNGMLPTTLLGGGEFIVNLPTSE